MRTVFSKKVISLVLIFTGILIIIGFMLFGFLKNKKPNAGLKIETNVPAIVFVDKSQIGRTPLDKIFGPGEVTVKLIPDSTSSALASYQTKVTLTNHTYTLIHRDFAPTESASAGDVVSLHPSDSKSASLTVLSTFPDRASVSVNGQPQGTTPLVLPQVDPGDHQIVVTSPGFQPREVTVAVVAGFRLQVAVKLASLSQPEASASATPVPTTKTTPGPTSKTTTPSPSPRITPQAVTPAKPYVKIGSTPTGFLRVRSRPSTAASEIGQVKPGEMFPLLDQEAGWYLIEAELEATSSGWISAQYATKYE